MSTSIQSSTVSYRCHRVKSPCFVGFSFESQDLDRNMGHDEFLSIGFSTVYIRKGFSRKNVLY